MTEELGHHKITPTADLIAYYRVFSETPYTAEIAQMTGAEKLAREIVGEQLDKFHFMAAMSEARYKKIDLYAKKFANVLEVAVGRSPRGLIFTEDPEVNYVSTDLPDSLDNHRRIMRGLMDAHQLARPNLQYAPVNVLNYEELAAAAKLLPPGKVAIISEGMMVYFSLEEKKIFLENARRILEKRGGAVITSDIMVIPDHAKKSSGAVFEHIARTSGRDIRDSDFPSVEAAKEFISGCGFNSELFNPQVELTSVKKLGLENDARTQRLVCSPVWVLTVK